MLPASMGDALWVEYGDPDNPNRFLIDGGLVGTADSIRKKILDIADREGGKCKLELLVLSHIDADHIEGLIKLLGTKDLPLEIGDLWFNGWHHLPDPGADSEDEFLGGKQGEFLAALIRERDLPWNQAFDGDTIYVTRPDRGPLPSHTLPGGMELVVVSPTYKELLKLSKKWEDELETAGLLHATHDELMAALEKERRLAPDDEFLSEEDIDVEDLVASRQRKDTSAANGSSIAFVGTFEGKRCLFSGDAYWTVLEENVARLAREENLDNLPLEAFKIPHHGSRNNISDSLLQKIDCHRFLVSTNGSRFQHPDIEAIARIVGGSHRPAPADDASIEIAFNYRTRFNESWGSEELNDKWNFKAVYPDTGHEGLRVKL